jgi:D-glycero-alpha-D-manno-heptose-7-phosphate kinase
VSGFACIGRQIVRSRAPLRIGLAGGGTDVSPYCDEFGGLVLNATIDMHAHAAVLPSPDGQVRFIASDVGTEETLPLSDRYGTETGLRLHRGVYNRIIADFNAGEAVPMTVITSVDCPYGSGLGASSALTVALVEALCAMLGISLCEYDVARLALRIERTDLGLLGGRQDQFAAAFGGVNLIEFGAGDRVTVNPLPISKTAQRELESATLLFFTGVARSSAKIIGSQMAEMRSRSRRSLAALHQLKSDAAEVKTALVEGKLGQVAEVFRRSWSAKKATARGVSTPLIDAVYERAIGAGALAGKVSGAGGGGFMLFLVDPAKREEVVEALTLSGGGGTPMRCSFTLEGSSAWAPQNRYKGGFEHADAGRTRAA